MSDHIVTEIYGQLDYIALYGIVNPFEDERWYYVNGSPVND